MGSKVFRDPLYNYIAVDLSRDRFLIDLLDTEEMQRLRRIHQLGVSFFTYPGSDHNRLAHSLGVVHLMLQALRRLQELGDDAQVQMARVPLLAAALLHDVGHGPFSHLFEPCLGIDHEDWSIKIITFEGTNVNRVLRSVDPSLPQRIAGFIRKEGSDCIGWQKYLISSQLDVDRLDYLRRDSLFTGAGYGHFDWFRILNTFELHGDSQSDRDIVWPEKAKFAIEEYIFARYYMYQNVYLHKTTRGFEKILEAMWRQAKVLMQAGEDTTLVSAINDFWKSPNPEPAQYLKIEEFTVMQQIQVWTDHRNKSLQDLARRFLNRNRFIGIDLPATESSLLAGNGNDQFEHDLKDLVKKEGYDPDFYCLLDTVKGKYHQPYFPEKESDEQSAKNAIRIKLEGESNPIEISRVMERLKPVTSESPDRRRYYVPKAIEHKAKKLASQSFEK